MCFLPSESFKMVLETEHSVFRLLGYNLLCACIIRYDFFDIAKKVDMIGHIL